MAHPLPVFFQPESCFYKQIKACTIFRWGNDGFDNPERLKCILLNMSTLRKGFIIFSFVFTGFYFNSCVASHKIPPAQQDKALYSFIFCNDLHISTPAEAFNFSGIVQQWNSFSKLYDFVVVGGDLVNDGTTEELRQVKKLLSHLKRPYYTVVGNHDVSGVGEDGRRGYCGVFGSPGENYSILHKKTALIFLDLSRGMDAHVSVDAGTRVRLLKTLETIPVDMPVLVFSHFPLHPNTPQFPVQNTDSLFTLLDSRAVICYFSGHYHGCWQAERNGVLFVTNAGLSLRRDNHDGSADKGYLLVTVYPSYVKTQFYKQGSSPVVD
jgi:calcineurin-like phosphoesterase family protein